jgi:DNA topoisomerase VI subunit B
LGGITNHSLQITPRHPDNTGGHRLHRQTFMTSRLAEFCSLKELRLQTGHAADLWPLVLAQELADNGLDAGEEAGIAPRIDFVVAADTERPSITVRDNGPGIAPIGEYWQ